MIVGCPNSTLVCFESGYRTQPQRQGQPIGEENDIAPLHLKAPAKSSETGKAFEPRERVVGID